MASLAGTVLAEAIDGSVSNLDIFSKIKIPTFSRRDTIAMAWILILACFITLPRDRL
jgi:hypothetical protein